jgi:hypothetical protein
VILHGPVPETFFPSPTMTIPLGGTGTTVNGKMSDGVRDQITRTLREFGFTPKGHVESYQKP